MRERLSKIDRRTAIAGLVVVASTALLLVGLVSIVAALSDDKADLPNEGSLEVIVKDSEGSSSGEQDSLPKGPAPTRMIIADIGVDPTSKDVLTLITCGGTWLRDYSNPNGGNYSHRVVVRAERVSGLASEQAGSEG